MRQRPSGVAKSILQASLLGLTQSTRLLHPNACSTSNRIAPVMNAGRGLSKLLPASSRLFAKRLPQPLAPPSQVSLRLPLKTSPLVSDPRYRPQERPYKPDNSAPCVPASRSLIDYSD
jgi:hypothetical protein